MVRLRIHPYNPLDIKDTLPSNPDQKQMCPLREYSNDFPIRMSRLLSCHNRYVEWCLAVVHAARSFAASIPRRDAAGKQT